MEQKLATMTRKFNSKNFFVFFLEVSKKLCIFALEDIIKNYIRAIAISDVSLKEIYNLSTEDKLDLVDMIIKSMKSAVTKAKPNTGSWVDQFEGKWRDSKNADEMVADIRASRTTNSSISL